WHVEAPFIEYIGKEANRWEEQVHLGEMPDAQISYGIDPKGTPALVGLLQNKARTSYGYVSRLAREAGLNRKTADLVVKGKSSKPDLLAKLFTAYRVLESRELEQATHIASVLDAVRARCRNEGS